MTAYRGKETDVVLSPMFRSIYEQIVLNVFLRNKWTHFIRFSRDGEKIFAVGDRGNLRIWDIESQGLVGTINDNIPYNRGLLKISPDEKILVWIHPDMITHIWDIEKQELIHEINFVSERNEYWTSSVEFTHDGKYLVYVFQTSGILVFNTNDWSLHKKFPGKGMLDNPHGIVGQETKIGINNCDKTISIYDIPSDQILARFGPFAHNISHVFFNQTGDLVCVRVSGILRFFDINKNAEVLCLETDSYFNYGRFSYDSNFFIFKEKHAIVRAVKLSDRTVIPSLSKLQPEERIQSVEFAIHPFKQEVAISCGNFIEIINLDSFTIKKSTELTPCSIYELVYSPDGNYIAVGANTDEIVRIIDADTGKLIRRLCPLDCQGVHFSRTNDNQYQITLKKGDLVIEEKNLVEVGKTDDYRYLLSDEELFSAFSLSPEEKHIAVGLEDGTIQIWDFSAIIETKKHRIIQKQFASSFKVSTYAITSIAWNPESMTLFATDRLNKIYRCTINDAIECSLFGDSEETIRSLHCSPNGTYLASIQKDGNVAFRDTTNGIIEFIFEHKSVPIIDVTFSHDTDLLASSDVAGKICIWEFPSKKLLQTIDHGTAPIIKIHFDSNPSYLKAIDIVGTYKKWLWKTNEITEEYVCAQEKAYAFRNHVRHIPFPLNIERTRSVLWFGSDI